MKASFVATSSTLAVVLRTVRCFNAAAFAALAFLYFAAYCLPPLPSFSLRYAQTAYYNSTQWLFGADRRVELQLHHSF